MCHSEYKHACVYGHTYMCECVLECKTYLIWILGSYAAGYHMTVWGGHWIRTNAEREHTHTHTHSFVLLK